MGDGKQNLREKARWTGKESKKTEKKNEKEITRKVFGAINIFSTCALQRHLKFSHIRARILWALESEIMRL